MKKIDSVPFAVGIAKWISFGLLLHVMPSRAIDLADADSGAHPRFIQIDDEGINQNSQVSRTGLAVLLAAYELRSNALVLRQQAAESSAPSSQRTAQLKVDGCLKGPLCQASAGAMHRYEIPENLRDASAQPPPYGAKEAAKPLLVLTNATALEDPGLMSGNSVVMRFESEQDLSVVSEVLRKFPIQAINREMAEFNQSLQGKAKACEQKESAYCFIASNDKTSMTRYLAEHASQEARTIADYLLLDFSIKIRNDEMALLLTSARMPSLHFASPAKRLFGLSFHDLPRTAAYLMDNSVINVDAVVGEHLTALGIAVQRNSPATIDALLDHGAELLGDLLDNQYPLAPMMKADNHELFDRLLERRSNSKQYPPLLHRLLFDGAAYGQVDWLKQKRQRLPALFDATFVSDTERGTKALLASALLPDGRTFSFLVDSHLDPCLAFGSESFRSILSRSNLMQGSMAWVTDRYRKGMGSCAKRDGK